MADPVPIQISAQNMDAVQAALRKYGAEAEKRIARDVTATGLSVLNDIKKRIQRPPKSGIVYKRGPGQNLSPTHQASREGEAPATDTGRLVSSIQFEQKTKLSAQVYSNLAYAYYLEFGTLNGDEKRMGKRPAWRPAADAGQELLVKRIEKTLTELSK